MDISAANDGDGRTWLVELPNGLYVWEVAGDDRRDSTTDPVRDEGARRWRITGRNPDFWWDIVVTRLDNEVGGFELHCTRCGLRDNASSMDDLLRLVRAGAHFHDTDPAG